MAPAATPHVLTFGGGVVKEGAADTQRTDELEEADGYEIGARGALVAGRDLADYIDIKDRAAVPARWDQIFGLASIAGNNFVKQVAVGYGDRDVAGTPTPSILLASFDREGGSDVSGTPGNLLFDAYTNDAVGSAVPAQRPEGVIVTFAQFPGVYPISSPAELVNVFLVNIGAREGFAANVAPGLYAVVATPPSSTLALWPISTFDALGTGARGELAGGAKSNQLHFRGIAAYNSFAIGWGFDSRDTTDKDGPARLMFSNVAKPLKWGNDNQAAGADRDFADSDAVVIGDAGEVIRAGLSWGGRFWIGTDKQLHYLAGYGRDSFLTDGANPVAKAENVLGAHCLIEGPDKLLYGVGDNGLWAFDGATFERCHQRLRDYKQRSAGWWDLIWTNRLRLDTYPGRTNADLVWMATDWDNEQVIVGIPWCNASAGADYGLDTVVVKYHVRTGGFTRQVFTGVQYTAADYMRRQRQFASTRLYATPTAGVKMVRKYGERAATTGKIASPLPSATIGPYCHYGPDGVGVYQRVYLTLAWEDESTSPISDWTVRSTPASEPIKGLCWSSEKALFVGVGSGAQGVLTSPDGITWTPHAAAAVKDWHAVVFAPELNGGAGLFVAVGNAASTQNVMTSPDGSAWTIQTSAGSNNAWVDVAYSPTLQLLVAVEGGGAAPERLMTSPDGIVWTDRTATIPAGLGIIACVCWSSTRNEFLALAHRLADTTWVAIKSADGINWTSATDIITSSGHTFQYGGIVWSPKLGLYAAVDRTANQVWTSADGTAWTANPAAAANTWWGIAWSEESELFVSVAFGGSGNQVQTSTDGAEWTIATTPQDAEWQRVVWAKELGRFVACAIGAAADRIMTSDALASSAALRFAITASIDGQPLEPVRVSVQATAPVAPAEGDVWLDLSGTDTNLGNATAGTLIRAQADYLVKRYVRGAWESAFFGGQQGNRATIPIAFEPTRGTRISVQIGAELADRRWQIEGLGFEPAPIASAQ